MKIGFASALIGVSLLAAACREAPSCDDAHEHGHHDEVVIEEAVGEGTLAIEPTMLRDLRLTTAPTERRAAGTRVIALGDVQADATRRADASVALDARVVRVLALPGETVAAGAPLAELESPELARLRAELFAAQVAQVAARAALSRKRELAPGGVVPASELEAAQTGAARADAEVVTAQAALEALDATDDGGDGGRWRLRAPLAGTVLSTHAVAGRWVAAGESLFALADLSRVWLVAHVAERDALRVRLGGTAEAACVALPGETLTGIVTWIGPELEAETRTIPVRVELENADGRLRPGLAASVRLPLAAPGPEVLTVPAAAMQRGDTGWLVFVPAGEARFEIRPVARGRDLGDEVEVLGGLAEGERVVVEGAFLLRAERERRVGGGGHHDH